MPLYACVFVPCWRQRVMGYLLSLRPFVHFPQRKWNLNCFGWHCLTAVFFLFPFWHSDNVNIFSSSLDAIIPYMALIKNVFFKEFKVLKVADTEQLEWTVFSCGLLMIPRWSEKCCLSPLVYQDFLHISIRCKPHLSWKGKAARKNIILYLFSPMLSSENYFENVSLISCGLLFVTQVKHTLGYDTLGHCFFLEDGIEHRNTFYHNLGLLTRPGTLLPTDRNETVCISIKDKVYKGYTPSPSTECK